MRRDRPGALLGALLAFALALPANAHDLWLVANPPSVAPGSPLRLDAATGMKFPESLSAVPAA